MKRMHPAPVLPVVILIAACAGTSPEVLVGPERTAELVLGSGASVAIALPPGEAIIEGVPGGNVLRADMEIRCPSATGACARRAADARWVIEPGASQVTLRPSEGSFAFRDMEATVRVSVPDDRPLRIDMPAGDLTVKRVSGCLVVDMEAGDVEVEVPAASVRSARADANFGDASLDLPGDSIEGRRPMLVGAEVEWQEGSGACDLAIDLSFGDIRVNLY